MIKEVKLKLCPFCGGKAELSHGGVNRDTYSYVYCKECHVKTEVVKISLEYCSDERAIESWNNRINKRGDNNE